MDEFHEYNKFVLLYKDLMSTSGFDLLTESGLVPMPRSGNPNPSIFCVNTTNNAVRLLDSGTGGSILNLQPHSFGYQQYTNTTITVTAMCWVILPWDKGSYSTGWLEVLKFTEMNTNLTLKNGAFIIC